MYDSQAYKQYHMDFKLDIPYYSFYYNILDSIPDFVSVDTHFHTHVSPQGKKSPFMSLTNCFISVRSEVTIPFVNAIVCDRFIMATILLFMDYEHNILS